MAYGDSIIIKRASDGLDVQIDNQGRLVVSATLTPAEIQRVSGDTVLRDGTTASNRAQVYPTGALRVSGDMVLAKGTNQIGSLGFVDNLVNGIINGAAQSIELSTAGLGSIGIQIQDSGGAWSGALEFDGTVDGTNWVQIRAVQFGGVLVGGTTVNGLFFAQVAGLLKIRVYSTSWVSGAVAIWIEGTAATNAITIANSLPIGDNNIGNFDIASSVPIAISSMPNLIVDRVGSAIDISGDVDIKPSAGADANVPLAVRLTDGSAFYNAGTTAGSTQRVSGDLVIRDGTDPTRKAVVDADGALKTTAAIDTTAPLFIGRITAPVGVSGDVSVTPKAASTWDVSDRPARDNGKIDIAAFDVALPAGSANIGDVDIASSVPLTIGVITAPLGISGDISTKPLAGQTWNVAEQTKTGVHVASGLIGVSGDVGVSATQKSAWSVSVSGDVLLRAGSSNIGDVDVLSIAAGSNNIGDIDVLTIPVVGVNIIGGGLNALSGDTAHDAVDANNPIKIGGKASLVAPTAVANADRVNAYFDTQGRQAVFDGGYTSRYSGDFVIRDSVTSTQRALVTPSGAIRVSGEISPMLIVDTTNPGLRAQVFSGGALRVSGDRYPAGGGDYGNVAVTASATLIAGARADTKSILISPFGTIYIGLNNSVTTALGIPLYSGDVYSDDGLGIYNGGIYGITGGGSVNVRYQRRW